MTLARLFDYDRWANAEEVRHLRSVAAPQRALDIFSHVIGTEWLWLGRIRGDAKPAVVWPKLTLDECASQLEALHAAWKPILAAGNRSRAVEYVNSKGEPWSSSVDDILTHVVLHSAYHRGQVAILVRDSGQTPAYTDYIHCVRNRWID